MLHQLNRSLRDILGLPGYWRASTRARRGMTATHLSLPYGPHSRQYTLLLEPEGTRAGDDLPWACYLHGGAWTFGTPESFSPAARPWLAAGFRVVLPSYRRPPRATLSAIVADCRSALAAVAAYARETGRPLSVPQIGGISAGGHLAALLALHPEWWTAAGWPAGPDRALLCAAPLDFSLLAPQLIFGRFPDLNPLGELGAAAHVRWLLLHGTADGTVDYRHSLRFLEALEARDAQARLIPIPAGGHLAAGRWTFDDANTYAAAVAEFIRSAGPIHPGRG